MSGAPVGHATPQASFGSVPGLTPIGVGQEPRAELLDPSDGFLYVANFESGTVSVLNGTSVVATVAVGSYPIAMTLDTAHDYIDVANSVSLNVSIIYYNAFFRTFDVASVAVGSRPHALAFDSADGDVYVANSNSDNVTVIARNRVVANLSVGVDPEAVAYSPLYHDVYVANAGAGTVSVIQALSVVANVTVGTAPIAFAYDPNFLFGPTYVANSGSHNLSALVGSAAVAGPQVGTDPVALAVDPGNGDLYVANQGSDNLSVVTGSGSVLAVSVSAGPDALAYDSANGFLYVADSTAGDVTALDGPALTVATVPVGSDPIALLFDNASGLVYTLDYAPGGPAGEVAALAETAVVGSVGIGQSPSALAYDPANGYVYVANRGSLSVSVLSGMTVVTTIAVPAEPVAIVYDPVNGDVYVGQWNFTTGYNPGLVSAIQGTALVPGPPVDVGLVTGLDLAVDNTSGTLYVADQDFFAPERGNVTVIAGTAFVANVAVGYDPYAVAYDAGRGEVYVANLADTFVSILRGTRVVGNVTNLLNAAALAYDRASGYVYVGDYFGGVTVVNNTTVVAKLPTGREPQHLLVNPVDGDLYTANMDTTANSVTVISGTADVGNVSVGDHPISLAADTRSGAVYVSNSLSDDLSVLAGLTALGTIPIGAAPFGASPGASVFDPANGYLYVATAPDTVSLIGVAPLALVGFTAAPATLVTGHPTTLSTETRGGFGELAYSYANLPPGCASVDGPELACTPAAAGRYVVAVQVTDAIREVATANLTVVVTALPVYPVAFDEGGLRSGTNWTVVVNGTARSSLGDTVAFALANGSYTFSVGTGAGYTAHPASGAFAVNGSGVSVAVTFAATGRPVYNVTFTESGGALGTSWNVTLNGTTQSSTGSSLSIAEPDGSYGYTVAPPLGETSTPAAGTVTVAGAPTAVALEFAPIPRGTYAVTFVESGLTLGTSWSVTLGGSVRGDEGAEIVFVEPNGSYPFAVGTVPGYAASPASGTVPVAGTATTRSVSFAPSHAGGSGGFGSGGWGASLVWIVALVVLAGVAGAVAAIWVRRRRPAASAPIQGPEPPSGEPGPPPS